MWTLVSTNYLERQNYFLTKLSINLLAFISSCVKPFIHAVMSRRFQGGIRSILLPVACIRSCQPGSEWPPTARPSEQTAACLP
ncbi:hypothetical protein HPB52_014718 [Rhipicephalus sanguineus]|uniref:Uncharacterized protein n=1 Tax=Rhipicephalus sanguineus TaxID=34632 RepID=A0A9D4PH36_RHISA|nr:hypothetical protein HPB52_014718 [Rhipicephalus sanguineus]